MCLRTPELRPQDLIHHVASDIEREAIVSDVLDRRARLLLAEDVLAGSRLRERLRSGKLLLFDPIASLSGGGTSAVSKGFFDDANIPPWDSWVYYFEDKTVPDDAIFSTVLLSWVPDFFVRVTDKGIRANPEGCLSWATDASTGVTRALKHWNLLR